MTTKVQKWGNSLGIRIPRAVAEHARLCPGTDVRLRVERGRLIVAPAFKPKLVLKLLLARVTRDNVHNETATGRRVGREVW